MQACAKCRRAVIPRIKSCPYCGTEISNFASTGSHASKVLLVGTHPECDIVLNQDGVRPFHAVLWMDRMGGRHLVWPAAQPLHDGKARAKKYEGWEGLRVGRTEIPQSVVSNTMKFARDAVIVGRAADVNIRLDDQSVSAHHLAILPASKELGRFIVIDLGSTNGSFAVSAELKIRQFNWQIIDASQAAIICGNAPLPSVDNLGVFTSCGAGSRHAVSNRVAGRFSLQKEVCVVGRDAEADLTLPYPQVSRQHVEIRKTPEKAYRLTDLGSTNGTFVGGHAITRPTIIPWGGQFRIGPILVRVDKDQGDLLFDRILGAVSLRANQLLQSVSDSAGGRKVILRDVSLEIKPGELVAIMGPSGSGKSTLINLLNGYNRPDSGSVSINGMDIEAHFDEFRELIGYVPQDDIIHAELTVWETLYFKGRLRLPKDLSDAELESRINEVINELGLMGCRDVQVGSADSKKLSGGQRKRVNLASELIADPPVLILDEPTSGLSSHDALEIANLLRAMADQGRTIVMTIHQPSPEIYNLTDKTLFLAQGGAVAFFGKSSPDSFSYFGVPENSPEAILRRISETPPSDWEKRKGRIAFPEDQKRDEDSSMAKSGLKHITGISQSDRRFSFYQFGTLTRRTFKVKVADKPNLVFLMLQAPLIGGLLEALYSGHVSDVTDRAEPLFILCISTIFLGAFNAAREFTSERSIFRRERMGTLQVIPYVLSKFFPLLAIGVAQALILVLIGKFFIGLKGDLFSYWMVITVISAASSALGLMVSALARSPEMSMAIIPIVLIFQIILSGYLRPLQTEKLDFVTAFSAPMISRWSTDALFEVERDGLSRHGVSVFDALQRIDRVLSNEKSDVKERDGLAGGLLKLARDVLGRADPSVKADDLMWQEMVQKRQGFTPGRLSRALMILLFFGFLYIAAGIWILNQRSAR